MEFQMIWFQVKNSPGSSWYYRFSNRLMLLFALTFIVTNISARTQGISLRLQNAPIEEAFREITKQSGYNFIYTREQLKQTRPVNITIQDATIEQVLEMCFRNQPLTYVVEERQVIIKLKYADRAERQALVHVSGIVQNEKAEIIQGVTVTAKKSRRSDITNSSGTYQLNGVEPDDILVFTCIGYQTLEVEVNGQSQVNVTMRYADHRLDETIIIAYGTTSRRLNTGNVSKLSAEQIAMQPVSNPLMALDGRIPGLTAVQGTGHPGAMVSIQVRGQSSLIQGSEPLFIIDGVPFAPGNDAVNQLGSALNSISNKGLSPFTALNTSEIESIEVLKDADATAIYGSRGANGVVLITTKKGKAGKTSMNVSFNTGSSRATRLPTMLNTEQYLQMRREAFLNDGINPTINNAPDLLVWDTTRYTDFRKLILGGSAQMHNASASVSGGNLQTSFMAGASWQKQTSIFEDAGSDNKAGFNLNLAHASLNRNFTISISTLFGYDDNRLPAVDPSFFLSLPPNAPGLYTTDGKLNWEEGGAAFLNPLAYTLRCYRSQTSNMVSNLQLSLRILKQLEFRTALGINRFLLEEVSLTPIASQNPATDPKGSAKFANSNNTSWIAEPQLHYTTDLWGGSFSLVAGGSYQRNQANGTSISADEYTNDALLQSLSAAPVITNQSNFISQYRYAAAFGRINYNYQNRYLLNVSGRRDGSSRFGPENQWATFAAAGAAWLFSNEKAVKQALPFLSYGKLRGSYGTAGNDQIGDYKYLDTWNASQAYQDGTSLYPSALFNPEYGWELTRKLEAAIELGVFNNNILFNLAWYRHRSSNQLLNYVLPSQTGFSNILSNFPATVENSGFEIDLTATHAPGRNFSWSGNFNISIPRNRLLQFPGIESSSYYATYIVGEPLNLIYRLHTNSVDPATGIFSFTDVNGDNNITAPADFVHTGHLMPEFFGGLGNQFSFKGLSLDVFFVFKKQNGLNYLKSIYGSNYVPGLMYNQPTWVLDRWQKPGDETAVQRFTASTSSAAYAARLRFNNSNGVYGDASFIRLKTLELSYNLPSMHLNKLGLTACRFYLQAQNLLTITDYKGTDPENQNLYSLPPLKTMVGGIQITL